MQADFSSFGVNRAAIYLNYKKEYDETDMYNNRDIDSIRRIYGDKLRGISATSSLSTKYISGKKENMVTLTAVNETYDKIDSFDIVSGRFMTQSDMLEAKPVIVMDVKFADQVLKTRDIIGKRITLQTEQGSVSYVVVGLYSKPKTMMNIESVNAFSAFVPISNMELYTGQTSYDQVDLSFKTSDSIGSNLTAINNLVAKRHNLTGQDMYKGYNSEREMEMMNKITGSMTLLVSVIAGISLVVGGIGIMNIMLVSVTERTREIGIRKAIGATRMDILGQFLIESALVSSLGGMVGIAFGIGLANLLGMFIKKIPPVVSPSIMLTAVAFSCSLGIFFGIYPANKASKLNPIDALRYE